MITKHTPGPWHIGHTSNTEEGKNEFIEIDSKKGSVARAWHPDAFDGTQKETEANARLIANAPKLLKKLNEARNIISNLLQESKLKESVKNEIRVHRNSIDETIKETNNL